VRELIGGKSRHGGEVHGCCWSGRVCVERIAERVERRTVLEVERAVIFSLCVRILEGRGELLLRPFGR